MMRRKNTQLFLMSLLLAVISCKENQSTSVDFRPGSIEKTSKNFLIPRDLKQVIEQDYLAYIRKENPKIILPDEEILSRIPREFLDVEVRFRSSAPGVLSDHTEFKLPRGGGEVNLKDYVIGKKGSFFMSLKATRSSDSKHELSHLNIYFLSETKQRQIGKETFGSGCRRYMDVTRLFSEKNNAGGLQLNATEQRYLSVIGGVFYFVNFDPERRIYIAAVRFTDTRYPDLLCEPDIISAQ